MLDQLPKCCLNCKSEELFAHRIDTTPYMPLLAGAAGLTNWPYMHVVVCVDCGYMMMFANKASCDQIKIESGGWRPLDAS